MNELIRITQLPIIEENLRSMKAEIEKSTSAAISLVCTPETLSDVKRCRSDLNKKFQELEEQRKLVKQSILAPYEQFNEIYKECVSDPFKAADKALKEKSSEVEKSIKAQCKTRLKEYFAELAASKNLSWLTYDRLCITVDMTSAKQKTPKKLMDQIRGRVDIIAADVDAISKLPDAPEIMAEYKNTLDMASSVIAVEGRHARIEEEKRIAAEWKKTVRKQEEAARRAAEAVQVDFFQPPVSSPPQENKPTIKQETEQEFLCTFKVRATKSQLRKIKEFLLKEEIHFE